MTGESRRASFRGRRPLDARTPHTLPHMSPHRGRRIPTSHRALLHLGAVVALAACSGGDGASGLPTEPPPSSSTGTPLASGAAVQNLSGGEGSTRLYRITVPAGATLLDVSTSGGTGDVDLYVRRGQPPSASGADCASEGDDNTERCTIASPAAGDWYVLVVGFEAFSGLTLKATVSGGGTTPPPSGSVSFMSARQLTPPGVEAGATVMQMAVTNAGAYFLYSQEESDVIARFESGASTTSGWTSFDPGFGIAHFAPASLTLERRESFAAYWVQDVYSCNYPEGEKAGLWVLNTNVPSTEWRNDVCAHAMIPSSSEQTTLAHSWIVATQHGSVSQPLGGFYVEQAQKQANGGLSGDFKKVADLVDYLSLAVSPKDNALWVGGIGKLYEIQENGTQKVYDLSGFGGTAYVGALKFQGETLWIAYGGEILRMQNGVVNKRFQHASQAFGTGSQFCVQGNTLYLAGGTRIDVTTGQARSYIADREIGQMTSPADIQKYLDLLQKTTGMLDCSTAGTSGLLYSVSPQGVFEIAAK